MPACRHAVASVPVTTLLDSAGAWIGINGFRMMPSDELAQFPATAELRHAAGGNLISVTYSWQHPADGPQEGLLVVGTADDTGRLTALWADTWHQHPASMSMTGDPAGEHGFGVEAEYGGGWRWQISVQASEPDGLRLQMHNV